jgi:histone deacetylase 6
MNDSPTKIPGTWPLNPDSLSASAPLDDRPKSPRIRIVKKDSPKIEESLGSLEIKEPIKESASRPVSPSLIRIKLINKEALKGIQTPETIKTEVKAEKPPTYRDKPLPATPEPKRSTRSNPSTPSFVALDQKRIGRETGIVYHTGMALHSAGELGHPEQPARIQGIYAQLQKKNLISRTREVVAREATDAELELVHTREYLDLVQSFPTKPVDELNILAHTYDSIYLNPNTTRAAALSCGSVVEMATLVWTGELRNGACIVRPPGHHAEAHCCKGFCIYANVAVAAKVLQKRHKVGRILIVDWDVHHGNGLQNAFYEDDRVLYLSLHRHDGPVDGSGTFYPHGDSQNGLAVGQGKGKGRNVNIPWPSKGFGDADYLHAFHEVVMPIAYEFDPDFVFVAAGFDAAQGDPLGDMQVSPMGYAHMLALLSQLAEGKIVVALEGGYNVKAISESFEACVRVLLSDPLPRFKVPIIPNRDAVHAVNHVVKIQSAYWKSLVEAATTTLDSDEEFGKAFSAITLSSPPSSSNA